MNNTNTRMRVLLATAAVLAMVPFNMGGCSEIGSAVGGMVGGERGAALGSGLGKAGSAVTLNESDEKGMGESVAMAVGTKYPIVSDAALNQYVALVGLTLAGSTDRPDRNWLFAVVETPEVNAFSGPDGFILITRGAIVKMQDESELAGVLGHEMTHVIKQHGLEAVKRAGLIDAGSTAAQGVKGGQFLQMATGAADVTLNRGYGRDEEDQADAGGVKLITSAGYDPHGYLHFIERMALQQGKAGAFPTHPGAADRAAKIKKQIGGMTVSPQAATLRERFEKMTHKGA